MSRALFIGRFQPFHWGHYAIVNKILAENDELIIGIGSAQESHTRENPFTAGERMEMIRATLTDEQILRTLIIPIIDIQRNSVWVSHVKSMVPKFDCVYANNPLVRTLFLEAGIEVKFSDINTDEYINIASGTTIRGLIENGSEFWRRYVPGSVGKVIDSFDGTDRIWILNRKERR